MRIAIPTNGGGLEDTVAPVFARAPAFAIIDVEGEEVKNVKVIQNPAMNAAGGAGPMAVQTLINEGVDAIVAPQVGPNALGAIQAAGIRLYQVAPGTPVEEAVKAVTSGSAGQFTAPVAPTAPAPAYGPYPATPAYPAYGFGPGWGRGWGRGGGWGRGRGWGRGWGRGGRGWGARLGYCPWTGRPSRRTLRWLYGWW
ncbi:iron-molybdenum cofactor-binding protein [Thermococcus guaymasensis DSM 11113]|uniref:Iron-molybdenum cofactor-binding protein n=1 Tax=Thermococcus guaymasensis DSM 11113 TaxID=1432656 RepID=A0A0X1KL81_9EURY|nr:NifB/NifX family molybdenum-iron cluster-binding protein [Thermococcus guaymasensis]AJC72022.1 iron-molybdenum cofactor-binding protein [Thermococcus guaymasensis DSM 11113]